jgi:DNA-binding NtrC family response regulator
MVKDAASYRWSSCGLYLTNAKTETFVDQSFVLGILNSDEIKAKEDYRRFINLASSVKTSESYENKRVLDSFRIKIIKLAKDIPGLRGSDTWDLLNDQALDKKIGELKAKGNLLAPEQKLACKYLIDQLKASGYNMSEIAERLEYSRPTLYQALKSSPA